MKNRRYYFGILLLITIALISCSPVVDGTYGERSSETNIEPPNDDSYKPYNFYDRAFPDNNVWNKDISNEPIDPNSDVYIRSLGETGTLWPRSREGIKI